MPCSIASLEPTVANVDGVEFVDEDAGTRRIEPADQVPQAVRMVDGVAVTRIVKSSRGGDIEICSYAADGRLLQRTVGR
jgi:hypothetical protein